MELLLIAILFALIACAYLLREYLHRNIRPKYVRFLNREMLRQHWSEHGLSVACGISKTHLRHILRGERKLTDKMAGILCKTLKISYDYLIKLRDNG